MTSIMNDSINILPYDIQAIVRSNCFGSNETQAAPYFKLIKAP